MLWSEASSPAHNGALKAVIGCLFRDQSVQPSGASRGDGIAPSEAAGFRLNGEYLVLLEVNEGAYGGQPHSDRPPQSIDDLMANTRNNPLEDLAMHIPMICEGYKHPDDVLDGFCSPEQAHDVYCIVIDLNTETIDIGGTNQRRAELEAPA